MPWSPLPNRDGPAPSNVAEVLSAVVQALGAPSVDVLLLVHERWSDVVGTEVAARARPVGMDGSTLNIVADNPTWASHLRWSEAEIVDRLRGLLGREEITAIGVRVAHR